MHLPKLPYIASLKHGFTLIELLVVIAIIGIIMSIGAANLITAQKQARDAARRQIIHNIQTAYEQYYSAFGSYPDSPSDAFENGSAPIDPKNSGTYVIDYSSATSVAYCICATLEGGSGGNASGKTGTACTWLTDGEYYCAQNKQ